MTIINGTAGNDVLTGTSGVDTVSGGAGNDTINFGAYLTSADKIDGGAGIDTLNLDGDYATGVTLGATTLVNVEYINMAAGHSYKLTTNDATVASGQSLTVDASHLTTANALNFNGAAETNGKFFITGGAGNDTITGGSGADRIHGGSGLNVLNGGGGNDSIYDSGVGSTIDGGAGIDYLYLDRSAYTGSFWLQYTLGSAAADGVSDHTAIANIESLGLKTGSGDDTLTLSFNTPLDATGIPNSYWDAGAGYDRLQLSFAGSWKGIRTGYNLPHSPSTFAVWQNSNGANGPLLFQADNVEKLVISGTLYDDVITTGPGDDAISSFGGTDTISTGAGNDIIFFSDGNLNAVNLGGAMLGDVIDGGPGYDELYLSGNFRGQLFPLQFNANTMINVELIKVVTTGTLVLATNDATVAAGQTLTVDASELTATDTLNFSGAAETNGKFVIIGGAGTDMLTGGAGNDTLEGGAGNDMLNGGSGSDTASYAHATSGVTVNLNTTIAQVIGGGQGSDTLISIENLTGSAYNDTLTGNSGNNVMNLAGGGNDTAYGGAGNDTFNLGAALTVTDKIDGGTGTDAVYLAGNYAAGLTFGATTLVNVETLNLAAGFNYKLTTNDATVASGQTLTVNGATLTAGNVLTFNGALETNGKFVITGGAGNDVLTGGTGADKIKGGGGADRLAGGSGADIFVFGAVSDSTSAKYDTIVDFNAAQDKLDLWFAVTGIDTAITKGALSSGASFDANMTAAIGNKLASHHAVVFTPNSGSLSGQRFLLVDVNGIAGYQAGADLVLNLTTPSNMGSLGLGTFT